MAQTRKKPIPENHQVILTAIGNKIRELRKDKEMSIEKFCMENRLPRISYSNLESGKNFQITSLLTIIEKHPEIKSLSEFFNGI